MRNAGLSEARCQNEVSESKAPAASNVTSKVRSRRVTDSLQADGVPFGGYKIDNRGVEPIAARRTSISKSMLRLSVAGDGVRLFDNGNVFGVRGKRSARPPFFCEKVSSREKRRRAALCRRSPKKVDKRCPKRIRAFVVSLKSKQHLNQETKA